MAIANDMIIYINSQSTPIGIIANQMIFFDGENADQPVDSSVISDMGIYNMSNSLVSSLYPSRSLQCRGLLKKSFVISCNIYI